MVKRILAILIVCMLVVSAASPVIAVDTTSAGTVARKTLMELFTATWCGFCATYGPNADRAYDELGPQQVILLRNQAGRDGLDTEETNARANFYGVTGVPTLYVNGTYAYLADYSAFVQKIRDMNSVVALFQVSISAQVQDTTSQGAATIEVKSLTSKVYGNLHLIVALFEKVVAYEGGNGVKTHRFVVRDYLFGEVGEQVGLAGFQTRQFSYPCVLPNGSNPGDFGIAAWIQDFSTKEVLQAESAEIAVAGQGQYTVAASAGEGGTISPVGATTVDGGKDQVYVVVPAAGHHIQDVVIDGVPAGAVTLYTFTKVQASHTIHASFAPDAYTLTVTPPVYGTVTKSPDQATYTFNASVTLTATPAVGYTFTGWSGDLTGTTNPITITMDADKTVTATFTAIPTYTLTPSAGTGGTITPNTVQTVAQGGSTTFTITPNAGYHIAD
ncbi:InlB B-repeat-containing protein, partial [Candidatus Cryosericum terrychapinii]